MLLSIDTSKASGPDGISGKMLKHTAVSIAPVITKLFNLSIQTGVVPSAWKTSTVVPIPKGKAATELSNYRPISLLSVCSKILERHVSSILIDYISDNHLLENSQWGFLAGKSTTTALLSVVHDWHLHLEAKSDVCAVFFDLRKAFDSVPHRPLLHKLENLGIDKFLLNWITSYLTERDQRVVVNGDESSNLPVLSGVPQGSVLGPLLFIIYVDGVSSVISDKASAILYADDMTLYRPIYTPHDYELLQRDINAISRWISDLCMQFNVQKCKYMVFSRKRSIVPSLCGLSIDDLPLEKVDVYKYLGVYLTSDLCWSVHIDKICAKSKKLVGMFHRRFFSSMDSESCRLLYKSYIRPHLEYACQVWDPHIKKDIEALEAVQRFALRACCKKWDAPYDILLAENRVPSLLDRRVHMKLCTMYKIVNTLINFPNAPVELRTIPYSSRHLHPLTLLDHQSKTNSFSASFFPSTCKAWNNLNYDVVSVSTFSSFKNLTKPKPK